MPAGASPPPEGEPSPAGYARRPERSSLDLTPREQGVVRLVLRGRPNKATVGELFASQKALEAHLRNARAKLGVGSRRELRDPVELVFHVPVAAPVRPAHP